MDAFSAFRTAAGIIYIQKFTSDAAKTLENYVKFLQEGDYDAAYDMLSAFDQGNISKELFNKWQSTAAKISTIKSFELDKKVDKFRNYEYMGAKFKKAYGFRVYCTREVLVPDIEMKGYDDAEDYRIMAAGEDSGWKIALLLTSLEDTVKQYERDLNN